MNPVIITENLKKYYHNIKAVDGVNLQVNKGEIFGIVGPNGAGKSTIVKLITGQIKPTSGSINVAGINPEKDAEKVKQIIGVIPEQEVPPSFLNSEEYLNFASGIRKIINPENRINEWFKKLDYEEEKLKLSKDLSRGTRQKLMITQAFFFEPAIAAIDEPLVNLDPLVQETIKTFMKKYVKNGNTILLCTVLSIAEELCDRIAFLKKGKIIETEKVSRLVKKYGSLEKAFLRIMK